MGLESLLLSFSEQSPFSFQMVETVLTACTDCKMNI